MTRDGQGQVHVFFNRCRHRGSLVCRLPYANAKSLRCPYHGWVYGSDGKLMGVPIREGFGEDFKTSDYGLMPPARVASYRGFVFASFSADVPQLDEHLGRVKIYLDLMTDRAPEGALVAQRPLKYSYPGNWKLQFENYSENYHPAFLHQSAFEVGVEMLREKYGEQVFSARAARDDRSVERSLSQGHGVCDFGGSRGSLWQEAYNHPMYIEALAQRHGSERAKQLAEADVHMLIYPNLLLHTRMSHYRVIKPLAVDHTEINSYPCKLKGAPDEINDTIVKFTSQHVSPGGEVQVDDLEAFARVQEGLKAEAVEWVLIKLKGKDEHVNEYGERECRGASEMMMRGQYQEWLRLMSAPEAAS